MRPRKTVVSQAMCIRTFAKPRLATLCGTLALFAACLAPAHAQCTRCCFPSPTVAVSPSATLEGQPVVVTVHLFNCSPNLRVISATVNVIPVRLACSTYAEAFQLRATIRPLQGRAVQYTLSAPTCVGKYTLKESSSNAPGTASTTLTVNKATAIQTD